MSRQVIPRFIAIIALVLSTLVSIRQACMGAEEPSTVQRIVSLAPSNTELIYSIGADKQLIGVSSYCDYPDDAKKKVIAGTFISPNLERLARLKPDLIVLVSGQEGMASMLSHNGYKTNLLQNHRLTDISGNLQSLATLTGKTKIGEQLSKEFEKECVCLKQITGHSKSIPKVFYCVWPEPLLTIGQGSYLTDVITACGGTSISSNLTADYPHFSIEKMMLSNPDVIIFPNECKDHSFLKKHPWVTLKAVKTNKVFFLPAAADDGLARPTLRLKKGMLWLSLKIHPELSAQLENWYRN